MSAIKMADVFSYTISLLKKIRFGYEFYISFCKTVYDIHSIFTKKSGRIILNNGYILVILLTFTLLK